MHAFDGLSLRMVEAETAGIVGENRCGRSVIMLAYSLGYPFDVRSIKLSMSPIDGCLEVATKKLSEVSGWTQKLHEIDCTNLQKEMFVGNTISIDEIPTIII